MQTIRRRPNGRRTFTDDNSPDTTSSNGTSSNGTSSNGTMPSFLQPHTSIETSDSTPTPHPTHTHTHTHTHMPTPLLVSAAPPPLPSLPSTSLHAQGTLPETVPSLHSHSHSHAHSTTSSTYIHPHSNNAEIDPVSDIPQEDLIMTPIVTANTDDTKAMDDSFIRRLSLGAYADMELNSTHNISTRTTPRRPPESGKYYLCPSNTFVASNGEVYHVDPFQLPPPSEIAELFQEINQRRVNSKQSPRVATTTTPAVASPGRRGSSAVDDSSSVSKKYPSLPAEWMRTPRTSMQESPKKKENALIPKTKRSSFSECEEEDEEEDDTDVDDEPFNFKKFSWRKFILAEMLGIGQPAGPTEPVAAESIDNFLSVPYKLECLIMFGCFVALDSFLYVITYLPIRFCLAVYVFADEVIVPRQLKLFVPGPGRAESTGTAGWDWTFPRNRVYDFMRGLLLVVGCYALSMVDMSRVYHYIRMQNTLKLYALTGMMEIIDKLLCSFGIDVLDSLFVKSQASSQGTSAVFTFIVAAVYVVIHSSLYFLHLATLTVAINNQDQSLITVLILNNFAEIKSSVLKKFDSGNLFQLACSDISERFKMFLFYTLIMIVGLAQARDVSESFKSFAAILLAMVLCEMTVDWIKHAFIAKFNAIKSNCYIDYSRTLRNDILNGHNDKITLDHSYTITKRLGMSQIPLGVVFFKFLSIGMSSSRMSSMLSELSVGQILCYGLSFFVLVLTFKVFLAVGLIYYTAQMNNQEKEQEKIEQKKRKKVVARDSKLRGEPTAPRNISSSSSGSSSSIDDASAERRKSVEALSNIERYTMLRGRINA